MKALIMQYCQDKCLFMIYKNEKGKIMINAVNDVMTQKTTDQYKIIEDKYETLCYYLRNFFLTGHDVMLKEDVDLIIYSLNKIYLCTSTEQDIIEDVE